MVKPIPIEIIKHYDRKYNSEKELLSDLYKFNTINEISKIMGYSTNFIGKRLKKYKIPIRNKGESVEDACTEKRFLQYSDKYLKTKNCSELSKEMNCSRTRIYNLKKKHNKKLKKEILGTKKRVKIDFKTDNMTQKEIAEKLGCTTSNVSKLLKTRKLKFKDMRFKKRKKHENNKTII